MTSEFIRQLNLIHPIAFFDLETTGTDPVRDRITQIAVIRIMPNGTRRDFVTYVNPTVPIPAAATEVTGITDEMVKDAPTFEAIAEDLYAFLVCCDFAGHNILQFDMQMLVEEFFRTGKFPDFPIKPFRLFDTMRFFEKIMPRTLDNAYQFFVGKKRESQRHDAFHDVEATLEVFTSQLTHSEMTNDPDTWHQHTTRGKKLVDFAGKISVDVEGYLVWTFGKNIHKRVISDPGYCSWVLAGDFPRDTKAWVRHAQIHKGKLE